MNEEGIYIYADRYVHTNTEEMFVNSMQSCPLRGLSHRAAFGGSRCRKKERERADERKMRERKRGMR